MTITCQDIDRLADDLVDGELDEDRLAEVEAHLAECAECRALVDDLRELQSAADALPRQVEPSRDLWQDIQPRLAAPAAPGVRVQPWMLAAAAALLIGVTAGLTMLWTEPPPEPVAVEAASPDWRPAMRAATDELEATLAARRDSLDPETVAVIEDNLRVIDRAIAECEAALDADPSSEIANEALLASWQKKIDLLDRASRIPPQS